MKSVSLFKRSTYPSEAGDGVHDLDLTPVMSVFVVLLPYLITMVVITQIAFIKFSLPPNVGMGLHNVKEKPQLKITVVIAPTFLAITHGEVMLDSLPSMQGNYPYSQLSSQLRLRKKDVDIQNELIVAVWDKVNFQSIITVMDLCRAEGFEKIGISQATQNAQIGR